jgi:glycosyltransferase involved in cell wall biosynthesis
MKTLICVNTLDRVASFVYQNHIAFAAYNAKHFPNDKFFWYSPHRTSIDTARNTAAIEALKMECDYLMFIDDDVLIPANAFEILQKADKDIIAGLVYLRGYPFHVMAFKQIIMPDVKDSNGNMISDPRMGMTYFDEIDFWVRNQDDKIKASPLVQCDAVGFSCCLIKTDVISPMQPPYFVTGTLNTEDVYFCLKTRELEPKPEIFVHTDVRPGHLLNPEPIEFDTRVLLTDFYNNLAKKVQEVLGPPPDPNPRFQEYIERNVELLQSK